MTIQDVDVHIAEASDETKTAAEDIVERALDELMDLGLSQDAAAYEFILWGIGFAHINTCVVCLMEKVINLPPHDCRSYSPPDRTP